MKLKKGDKVMVIAGKSRGKSGTIVRVLPQDGLVILDGINMMKKQRRASGQSRKGQIIERAMPLHVSNVMIVDTKSGKPSRIKITRDKDGNRARVAVKSGQELK